MANENERIHPMRWTDTDTDTVYTLDFNKESVRFAESKKFVLGDVGDFISSGAEDLFYYAMRMHHKNLSRTQTNALFKKLGGFTIAELERLGQLYQQAQYSNSILLDDEVEKNRVGTVELD